MAKKRARTTRRLPALWSSAKVKSCADGSMTVEPVWVGIREYTPEDGGGPGLLTRLEGAHALQKEINALLAR